MASDKDSQSIPTKVNETEVSVDTLKSSLKSGQKDSSRPDQLELQPTESAEQRKAQPKEIGGRGGLEPTRYGDWEKNGRCIDF